MTMPEDMKDLSAVADKLLKDKIQKVTPVPMSQLEAACCEAMHVMSLPTKKDILQEMAILLLHYIGGTALFLAFWWWESKLLDYVYCAAYGLGY